MSSSVHSAKLRAVPTSYLVGALAVALLAVLAILSLGYGGRAAWSDAMTLRARHTVAQWRDGEGPKYTLALWEQTRDDLADALQTTPDNGQLYDDLGFLYASRAQGLGTPKDGSQASVLRLSLLSQAITNYRSACVLRPTFPYTWAYLALAKQLRGELDAEFWSAFDKALKYGRNEPGVQQSIARVAFALWPALDASYQGAVVSMVSSASKVSRRNLVELADSAGLTTTLLDAIKEPPQKAMIWEDLGILHARRAFALGKPLLGSAEAMQQSQEWDQAVSSYRAATVLQADMAGSWAGLVAVKHARAHYDDEFGAALDQALQYGADDVDVQQALAPVAFAVWAGLTPERRAAVGAMVAAAKPPVRRQLLNLAQRKEVLLPSPQ